MRIEFYLAAYINACSLAIIGALLLGLHRSLTRAGWERTKVRDTTSVAAIVLLIWFTIAVVLSSLGVFHGAVDAPPTIQYAILIPVGIGVLLIWLWPAARRVVEVMPPSTLVGVQAYRLMGSVFLLLLAADRLPAIFALPAGFGDIAVGLLAPVVALAHARNPERRGSVLAWNLLGLTDFAVAIAVGFALSPSPFQLLAEDPAHLPLGGFPLVLFPAFVVPLSILLHIASLVKLRRQAASAGTGALAAA